MIDLSIIIVSWNVADLLAACLDSLFMPENASITTEIIVVDSASTDDTVALVQQHYPQVILLPQSENLGFVRCNNIGLAQAQGRYVLLLNPDTEIIGDTLPQLVAYMDQNPTVGITGPHTLNTDGTTQSTRRHFPSIAIGFFESTWLQALAPKSLLDHYYITDKPDHAVFPVDWVQGSALMARHAVYAQIGGLDPTFVMYSEELDWCKRAKSAGWEVHYVGTAQIIHHGGKSSEQVTARRHIHFQQSKLHYFHKHHGWLVAQLLRLFLLLNYLVQIGIEGAKRLLGHKPAMRQERIQAYWQVVRSGLRLN